MFIIFNIILYTCIKQKALFNQTQTYIKNDLEVDLAFDLVRYCHDLVITSHLTEGSVVCMWDLHGVLYSPG